jgi:hypothetical protein
MLHNSGQYTKEGGATRASGNSIFDRHNYVLLLDLFVLHFCIVFLHYAISLNYRLKKEWNIEKPALWRMCKFLINIGSRRFMTLSVVIPLQHLVFCVTRLRLELIRNTSKTTHNL